MDGFFQHIRSFLGLPKLEGRIFHEPDYRRNPERSINIFSEQLDFENHFVDEMNKLFGEFDLFTFRDIPGSPDIEFFDRNDRLPFMDSNELPITDDYQQKGLRSQFLKPGFERPSKNHLSDKTDTEVKESDVNIDDLNALVNGNYIKKEPEHPKVTTQIFGKSISTKTVINGDGSIEIHKTVRDNQGNEETTITKKLGDKEHTIIKKRDSSGKEEIIENLVNIDEKDKGTLLKMPDDKQNFFHNLFFK